jgi:methylmalonyl-CoA mutase
VANLLAAGGVQVTDAGAPVAVVVSSTTGYAEHAEHAVAAVEELRAGGAQWVLVAGRSHELGDAAGLVDGEVHDGMDVVAFLSEVLDRLGAPAATPSSHATTTTEGRR